MKRHSIMLFITGFATCLAVVVTLGAKTAAPTLSPVVPAANRDVYYPGTEDLAPDEMRVIACGTGHPMARPKQAVS